MLMYHYKNEHLDIETGLEYLIKPDVCPDWAVCLTFLNKDSDKEVVLPFTHLKIKRGTVAGSDDDIVHGVDINTTASASFFDSILDILRNIADYPSFTLFYGVPNRDDPKRRARPIRTIQFSGYRSIQFICDVEEKFRYNSTLYLSMGDVELIQDDLK